MKNVRTAPVEVLTQLTTCVQELLAEAKPPEPAKSFPVVRSRSGMKEYFAWIDEGHKADQALEARLWRLQRLSRDAERLVTQLRTSLVEQGGAGRGAKVRDSYPGSI